MEKTGVAVPIFVVCLVIVGAVGAFAGYKMAPAAAPSELADGSVTTPKLADGAVTGAKIADGTITSADIANDAVTTGKIADNSITLQKLASSIVDMITGVENIADNSITSAKIQDGTITDADITTAGISRIADGAVTTSDLAMGAASQAVGVTRIADASTSSTTMVDVPDMTINITTGNNPVLILFSMNIYHVKTASGSVRVRLLVDGATEAIWEQFDYTTSSAWYSCPITVLKFLSAGAHTIDVQWSVDTGTAYNPATFGYRSLIVIELKNASP